MHDVKFTYNEPVRNSKLGGKYVDISGKNVGIKQDHACKNVQMPT